MLDPEIRALIVEDQGELRRGLVAMLKKGGVRSVHSSSTGKEGLELLQTHPVDLILCNWDAPEVNGIALLRHVRENSVTENVPFIMVSGELDDDAIAEAAEYEADGHLFKPLTEQVVEDKINNALVKRASTMEMVVRLARAGAFSDIGAFEEAMDELKAAHKIDPRSPRVWTETGEVYELMGDNEKARSCYKEAIKKDENYPKAYDHLGDLYHKEGKADEAIEAIQHAARISPRNVDRQMRFSKAHLTRGDVEAARTAARFAVSHNPDDGSRNAAVAEFFLANGRSDIAEEEFAFALEADPENVHYYNRLGIAFRRQKKFSEAVQNYRKAIAMSSADPVIYYNMARALLESGDAYQATAAFRRALMLNPNFKEAEQALKKLSAS